MNCRVGITTDSDRRKQEWKKRYPRLRKWQIISRHRTKTAAQNKERAVAEEHGCYAHPGGSGPERGAWNVYHFYL